jgi:hypothetical protein
MSLSQFKGKFGSGIRPNLYDVTGTFGGAATALTQSNDGSQFLIKAAAVPSATLGIITIPFRGREVKRAGDRTFTDWSITVLCDAEMDIHRRFMDWSSAFIALESDERSGEPMPYGQWTVTPQNNAGVSQQKFTLVDCWPMEVGTMDLGYDNTDAVAEFTVTIGFDHWTYLNGTSE